MGFFKEEGRWGDWYWGRIIWVSALVFLPTCVSTCNWGNNFEYSKGTRAGVINKFSEKGIVWKTYEGQIALEGIVSTGESVGANVW